MGRELRLVPPNWQHPRDDRGQLQPMHHGSFSEAFSRWIEDFDRVRRGELSESERVCYAGEGKTALAEWLKDEGTPPDPAYYGTWDPATATWFQVWETVSEGTPVTPPFATAAELVDYLVEGGDDWDRRSGRGGYTRAQAEAFVSDGYAPSMAIINGTIARGIEIPMAMKSMKDGAP
jgi:hypothetical protein